MNYPVFSTGNRAIAQVLLRLFLVALFLFFVAILMLEMFSFIRLFEVTMVANPAINLIR